MSNQHKHMYQEPDLNNIPTFAANMAQSLGVYRGYKYTSTTGRKHLDDALESLATVASLDPKDPQYMVTLFVNLFQAMQKVRSVHDKCRAGEDVKKGMSAVIFHLNRYQKAVKDAIEEADNAGIKIEGVIDEDTYDEWDEIPINGRRNILSNVN